MTVDVSVTQNLTNSSNLNNFNTRGGKATRYILSRMHLKRRWNVWHSLESFLN